jgi:hypothetical protein
MKQYLRCKACGYIIEAGQVGKFCPACGLPAERFEPYSRPMSEKRLRFLDMHIHPIVVHFPQAFATTLVVLAAALAILGEGALRSVLLDAAKLLAALLPFCVAAAFAAGIADGKLRFRKVTTPILARKMIAGALFFAFSLGGAALGLFTALNPSSLAAFALLELLSLVSGSLLGLWGSGLMNAGFPGA